MPTIISRCYPFFGEREIQPIMMEELFPHKLLLLEKKMKVKENIESFIKTKTKTLWF